MGLARQTYYLCQKFNMRWIVPILILIVLQWYSFQAVKTLTSQKWIWVCYFAAVVLIIGNLVVHTLVLERSVVMEPRLMYAIGFFISLFVFQMIITLILLSEDVFEFLKQSMPIFQNFLDKLNLLLPEEHLFQSLLLELPLFL